MIVERVFYFDMAHMLDGHDGKCNNLHGHTYKVIVAIAGSLIISGPKEGMVVDFSNLKQSVKENVIDKMDHSFIYNQKNVNEAKIADLLKTMNKKTYKLNGRSTAENIAKEIFDKVSVNQKVQSVKVYETANSCAEYFGE